jgi:hypothetical protein
MWNSGTPVLSTVYGPLLGELQWPSISLWAGDIAWSPFFFARSLARLPRKFAQARSRTSCAQSACSRSARSDYRLGCKG